MFKYVKFAELPVYDQDRAVAFYTGKLGLKVTQDAPYGDGWRWIEIEIPEADTSLLLSRRPHQDPDATPRLTLVTDDVEAVCDDLKAKGVKIVQEPAEAPWSPGDLYALFRDSENNMIMIGARANGAASVSRAA